MHDKSEIWSVHPLRVQTSLAVKCFCLHTFAEHVCVVCIIMFWHNIPNQVWPCKNNQNTFVQHIASSCSRMQTDFGAILHFATVFVSEPKKKIQYEYDLSAHIVWAREKMQYSESERTRRNIRTQIELQRWNLMVSNDAITSPMAFSSTIVWCGVDSV